MFIVVVIDRFGVGFICRLVVGSIRIWIFMFIGCECFIVLVLFVLFIEGLGVVDMER